jgi:hypothetical protein
MWWQSCVEVRFDSERERALFDRGEKSAGSLMTAG